MVEPAPVPPAPLAAVPAPPPPTPAPPKSNAKLLLVGLLSLIGLCLILGAGLALSLRRTPRLISIIQPTAAPVPTGLSLNLTPGPSPIQFTLPPDFTWQESSPSGFNLVYLNQAPVSLPGTAYIATLTTTNPEALATLLSQADSLDSYFNYDPAIATYGSTHLDQWQLDPDSGDGPFGSTAGVILNENGVIQIINWGYAASWDLFDHDSLNPPQCPCTLTLHLFYSRPQTAASLATLPTPTPLPAD
ncbi:hypothetical protein A2W24_02430 [Microgenomates group bacterium RBG_16_45_19]|nr:MAG: hypothetical protein A2W24_02430 [Microgenomates group bacterium RBG_16_45_19]